MEVRRGHRCGGRPRPALLAAQIPGLAGFVGHVGSAIDATARGAGGLTPGLLAGVGVAGLIGGIALICLVGFTRNPA